MKHNLKTGYAYLGMIKYNNEGSSKLNALYKQILAAAPMAIVIQWSLMPLNIRRSAIVYNRLVAQANLHHKPIEISTVSQIQSPMLSNHSVNNANST
jgi:hypothetical protein